MIFIGSVRCEQKRSSHAWLLDKAIDKIAVQ